MTLVGDLDRGTIEFIAFDRKKSSLDEYYQTLSSKQLAGIEAVAMDMWEPYIASTLQHLAEAATKIVFDRFHVMKHMLEAVDAVRKAEHRALQAEGDERSRAAGTSGSSRRKIFPSSTRNGLLV